MKKSRLPFECLRRPLFGRAEPPAESKDEPPKWCANYEIIDDDEIRQTLWVDWTLVRANFRRLNWRRETVKVVNFIALENVCRFLIKYLKQIANAEQIVAQCQKQHGTLGKFKARRFRPESNEWEKCEDEAENGKDENAGLDNFLLIGCEKCICAAFINTIALLIKCKVLRARRKCWQNLSARLCLRELLPDRRVEWDVT